MRMVWMCFISLVANFPVAYIKIIFFRNMGQEPCNWVALSSLHYKENHGSKCPSPTCCNN